MNPRAMQACAAAMLGLAAFLLPWGLPLLPAPLLPAPPLPAPPRPQPEPQSVPVRPQPPPFRP